MRVVFCVALLLLVQHVGGDLGPYILVTRYADIAKLFLDTLQYEVFIREPSGWIKAVDYHYWLNIVFWSNIATNQIHRASLEDGSNAAVIVDSGMLRPVCLAVDWMNNKLYWSDPDMSAIEVYDILKQERKMMIDTLGLPLGIAVDPLSGWIYWTNRLNSMIERANMNAMNTTREMVTDSLMCPTPVVIDYENRMLCWTDYCSYTIQGMVLDGGEQFVIQDADIFFSEAMSLLNNTLYWIQSVPVGIFSTSKMGGEEAVTVYPGTWNNPFQDIKVVHSSRQSIHPDVLNCSYFHNCTTLSSAPTSSLTLIPTVTNSHTSETIADLFTSSKPPYLSPTVAFSSTPVPSSTVVELTTPSLSTLPSSLGLLHIHPTTTITSTILSTSGSHYVLSTPDMKATSTASDVLHSTAGLTVTQSASAQSPQSLSVSTTTSLPHHTMTSTLEETSVYTSVSPYSISPSPNFSPLPRTYLTPTSIFTLSTPNMPTDFPSTLFSQQTVDTSRAVAASASSPLANSTALNSPEISCEPEAISCLSPSASTVTHNITSLGIPQTPAIFIMDAKTMMMMFGGILAVLMLIIVGCMVCGFFIIRKKRRRLRYSIEEESREVRSSVQRNTVSSNKNYRYREDSSRCKIGSYTPRTLDFSDLPPWFSTPIEVGARMAFSFDGHSTTDNALRSPPGHGEKATRSLSMTMTRMSYFSNATEIVGKSSSRSTL